MKNVPGRVCIVNATLWAVAIIAAAIAGAPLYLTVLLLPLLAFISLLSFSAGCRDASKRKACPSWFTRDTSPSAK
ncbi:MAG: hypothetical protein E1N59_1836 [Puniceicoccaceae bacterium 5H]|nr:MAG: hypothetical protein E1N59_1836 [Puniceicoccaceae bacterium 5H]